MIRQILESLSQFEKAMLVAKLKGARERKKPITGKCGGRRSYAERSPELVASAKKPTTPSTVANAHCDRLPRNLQRKATSRQAASEMLQPQ